MDDRRPYDRRLALLKNERSSWESHWRDLQEYILPRRGRFTASDRNRGDKKQTKILDNTGTVALRTLASGMMSGITSPARPWFKLGIPDPDLERFGPVKAWLHYNERLMYTVFSRSNFYNSIYALYEELGLFGTSAMFAVEDFDDVLRCHALTVGEFWIANGARGSVDSLYREVSMTVGQLVEQFGIERVSTTVKSLWDQGNYDAWVECVHVIEPNRRRDPWLKTARNKPWVSVYYEKGAENDRLLSVSGFDSFPAVAPRWHVTGTDVYGRSPAMETLGDVKQLQTQQLRKAQGIDKIVNPPMRAPGAMKNQHMTVLPGGVTFVDTAASGTFEPVYQINLRLQELLLDIQDVQQRINRGLYADLFLMLAMSDRRQMTATEVAERHEEKLIALGPVLERLQDELLDPMIDRTFELLVEGGLVPPPPPELAQGGDLKVEYIGLLAQAQKMVGVRGLEMTAGFVGTLAAANPDALDKLDVDTAIDAYADAMGVPPDVVRGIEQVAEIRAQRARQQQAMLAAGQAQQAAQGAKTLAETDTAGDNALTRMLGIAG